MKKSLAVVVWASFMALALSGCAEPTADVPSTDSTNTVGDSTPIGQDMVVEAPEWKVGQYFGHHIFFGAGDTSGTHINTVVLDVAGGSYKLGTDNQEVAEYEAIFDVPILGQISQKDLSTTAFGGPWAGFDFPLVDGKSWSAQITAETTYDMQPITLAVDVAATYNDAIEMPGTSNTEVGFDIIGMYDGEILFETNYVPAIGWYATFRYYDLTTEDPDDYIFFVRSMGFGDNFGQDLGGVVYDVSSVKQLAIDQFSNALAADVQASTAGAFTVAEDSYKLMAIMYAFAVVAGHSHSKLIDPDGNQYGPESTVIPEGADPMGWAAGGGDLYDIPHAPGEWQFSQTNASPIGGGGIHLWELSEEQIIF